MTPEQLLLTDLTGTRRRAMQDVIHDGLDHDYSARYSELAALTKSGTPDQRFDAARMLASWGAPDGLGAITAWARDPANAPWAGAPVSVDRFSGADSAWEALADTLRVSGEIEGRSAESDAARDEATRALLGIYDRQSIGRSLMNAFDLDRPLAGRVAKEIASAVDKTIAAAKGADVGFDLATQAAWLIGGLAMVDDEHAAMASQALIKGHAGQRDRTRMLKELAYSLGFGTGPYTKAVLEALAAAPSEGVQAEAREALGRRTGKPVEAPAGQPVEAPVDALKTWAARVCTVTSGTVEAIAKALDAPGTVTPHGSYATIDPPPLGATKVMILGGEIGMAHVDVRFPEGVVTRAQLDATFGEGRAMPRVSANHPQQIYYEVTGSPGRCTVIASFAAGTTVILRTDKAR